MRVAKTLLVAAMGACWVAPVPVWAGELEELKAQMQQMMKRIEQLEAQQKGRDAAGKPVVVSGNDRVRVSLSGQINRAMLYTDDGESTDTRHVDNDASSTRVRVIAEADTSDSTTVGGVMEVEFESNSSADVSQTSGNDASQSSSNHGFKERKLELYVKDKGWGQVSLGQGDTASNGSAEMDLSGTELAGYSDVGVFGGGMEFRTAAGALSGASIGDTFTNLDGLSRKDRLRYDSPTLGGFVASVSHIGDDSADVALRYSADYDGAKVAAALAWADPEGSSTDDQWSGSLSMLLDGGFNLTLAAGEADTVGSGADPQFYYVKLGFLSGANAFSVDYQQTEDKAAAGDEASAYGFQYVRKIREWSTEAYAGVRQFQLDRPGADFQDISAVMAGARVKF